MRNVVSLSFPTDAFQYLKRRAGETGSTLSAYVLQLIKHDEKLISEEELLERCRQAEEDYRTGDYIALKTDADFDKFFKNLYRKKK